MLPQNPCPPSDDADARDVSAAQQGIRETSDVDLEVNRIPNPALEETEAHSPPQKIFLAFSKLW